MHIEARDIEDFDDAVKSAVQEFLENCNLEMSIDKVDYTDDWELTVALCHKPDYYGRSQILFEDSVTIPVEITHQGSDSE